MFHTLIHHTVVHHATGMVLWMLVIAGGIDRQNRIAADEVYEVRTFVLDDSSDEAAIDEYLQNALLPALARHGVGPVGVLEPTAADQTGINAIFVVLTYPSVASIDAVRMALVSDAAYQTAAKPYLDRDFKNPPYKRLRSELLVPMACWPTVQVADEATENADRVFELRVYESANERIGDLKVEMFNAGEVPIFLACGIQPVFVGQCLIGPQMPSLTYLTVYPSEPARLAAWEAFQANPEWNVLKKVPKYAGTVSRIDKFVLQPKPYSQM